MHAVTSTLYSGLGLFLALTTTNLVGVAAATRNAKLVPAPFNATAYNKLVACVREVSFDFHVAIDDGMVVIVPPHDDLPIDIDGDERALMQCLHGVSTVLEAAIDSDRSAVNDGAPCQTLDKANAQWAELHGAQGLERIPGHNVTDDEAASSNSVGERSVIEERARASYYFYLGSDYRDCSSPDLWPAVFNECINYWSGYRSIQFGNAGTTGYIGVSYWPHHNCAVDYPVGSKGTRTVSIPPASDCSCRIRNTYSWHARQEEFCYLQC